MPRSRPTAFLARIIVPHYDLAGAPKRRVSRCRNCHRAVKSRLIINCVTRTSRQTAGTTGAGRGGVLTVVIRNINAWSHRIPRAGTPCGGDCGRRCPRSIRSRRLIRLPRDPPPPGQLRRDPRPSAVSAGDRCGPDLPAATNADAMGRSALACSPTPWCPSPTRSRARPWPPTCGAINPGRRRASPRAPRCSHCCSPSCTITGPVSGGTRAWPRQAAWPWCRPGVAAPDRPRCWN